MKLDTDNRTTIDSIKINDEPDQRGKRKSKDKTYERFATIRNMVLDYVLNTDAIYYVSIDSDIMVHPDIVDRLVAQMEDKPDYGMIAGIVNNTRLRCNTIQNLNIKRCWCFIV